MYPEKDHNEEYDIDEFEEYEEYNEYETGVAEEIEEIEEVVDDQRIKIRQGMLLVLEDRVKKSNCLDSFHLIKFFHYINNEYQNGFSVVHKETQLRFDEDNNDFFSDSYIIMDNGNAIFEVYENDKCEVKIDYNPLNLMTKAEKDEIFKITTTA